MSFHKKITVLTEKNTICRNTSSTTRFVNGVLYSFNEKEMKLETYNEVASTIWKMIKKPQTLGNIIDVLVDNYDAKRSDIKNDIFLFILREAKDHGIFKIDMG